MKLVERSEELQTLEDLFSRCKAGRPSVLIVSGPPAVGKTALLESLAERVADTEAYLLSATGSTLEHTLQFGVIHQMLLGIEASLGAVRRRLESSLDARGPVIQPFERTAGTSTRMLQAVQTELLALSAEQPVVIVIDDAHHADVPSLQCLLGLAHRMRHSPIMMILAEGRSWRQAYDVFRAEITRKPWVYKIELAPLSRPGVSSMLAELAPQPVADWLVGTLYDASGGNPMLIRALIEDLCSASNPHPPVGYGFQQSYLGCLYRSDTGLRLAQGLAVLGKASSPRFLAELVGLDAQTVGRAVKDLNKAGLLDDGWFRHPAARTAVLEAVQPGELVDLHAKAAWLLHRDGAEAEVVARHLLAADSAVDWTGEPWVVQELSEAAEQLLEAGRFELAVDSLRLALSVSAGGEEYATLTSLMATAEWQVNPEMAGRRLSRLYTAIQLGELSVGHAISPIRYMLWHGKPREASTALEMVAQMHAASDGTKAASKLLATKAYASLMYPESFDAPLALEALLDDPLTVTDPDLQAAALLSMLHGEVTAEDLELLRDGLAQYAASQVEEPYAPVLSTLIVLIVSGQVETAQSWSDHLLTRAEASGTCVWEALLSSVRAKISLSQGDLPGAERWARRALTHMSPTAWGVAVGVPHADLLSALTGMGRCVDAQLVVREPLPEAMFETPFGLYYLLARGRYHKAVGRLEVAIRDLRMCGELAAKWGMDHPVIFPWRTEAAEAYLLQGNPDMARDLVNAQLDRVGPNRASERGTALRVLAATRPLQERLPLLDEALSILQECEDRYQLAHALADQSRVLSHLGATDRACMVVRRAYHLAEETGAELLRVALAQAQPSLSSTGGKPKPVDAESGLEALSEAERRVAALASKGYSNRQIAARLFVTVSTVEQHLTRVYRKLNVRRRSDLPAELVPEIVDSA